MRLKRRIDSRVAKFPRARFNKFLRELRVHTKDLGLQILGKTMLGTQTYLLDELEKGIAEGVTTFVILKARQLGMSTIFLALDLFWAWEHPGLSGCVATHEDRNRDQIRAIMEVFLAHLPSEFKKRVRIHNRTMLIFENGSQFTYLVAGTRERARKAGLGRGGSYTYAHRTETAFWGSEEDLKELNAAMSTHNPYRLQIDESTANGFNFFEERWRQAQESPGMRAIFIGWWRSELNSFHEDDPRFKQYCPRGFAEKRTALERQRCKDVLDQYGIEISMNQLAWYRWKLEDECANDQAKMDEMFPFTSEDAFQATGSKFFLAPALSAAMRQARVTPVRFYTYAMGQEWRDLGVRQVVDARASLRVWEEPLPYCEYTIGCDPAYGSSPDANRHAICVLRCHADKVVQVAEWCSVSASTYQCAWVLAHLAGWYRTGVVILEMNGPGEAVFVELRNLQRNLAMLPATQYDPEIRNCLQLMRHFLYSRTDSLGSGHFFQWKTTESLKFAAMSAFKDSFELSRAILRSMHLLEEMKSVSIEDGYVGAPPSKNDDRVIAATLAHEAWKRQIQPRLMASGATLQRWEESQRKEHPPLPKQAQVLAIDYLKRARIVVQ